MGMRVEVKFNKDYVASRGAAIAGRKGATAIFAESPDLDELIKSEVVEKVRTIKPPKRGTKAQNRETATNKTGEQS